RDPALGGPESVRRPSDLRQDRQHLRLLDLLAVHPVVGAAVDLVQHLPGRTGDIAVVRAPHATEREQFVVILMVQLVVPPGKDLEIAVRVEIHRRAEVARIHELADRRDLRLAEWTASSIHVAARTAARAGFVESPLVAEVAIEIDSELAPSAVPAVLAPHSPALRRDLAVVLDSVGIGEG